MMLKLVSLHIGKLYHINSLCGHPSSHCILYELFNELNNTFSALFLHLVVIYFFVSSFVPYTILTTFHETV